MILIKLAQIVYFGVTSTKEMQCAKRRPNMMILKEHAKDCGTQMKQKKYELSDTKTLSVLPHFY